jgi:hypothetical protein
MSKWTLSTWACGTPAARDSDLWPTTSGDGNAGSRSTLHEFTATETNREQWTAAFWALFPSDEETLVKLVQSTGISAAVSLDFEPKALVQPEYGGVAAHRLSRLLLSDTESSHLDRLYGPREVSIDDGALAQFKRDLAKWQREYKIAADRCSTRLPHPPLDFVWIPDMGGIIWTREVGGWSAPEQLTFRLWRHNLGYMPASE